MRQEERKMWEEKFLSYRKILVEQYGIEPVEMRRMTAGAGGETFLVNSNQGNYVFKLADVNTINRPKQEPKLCIFLREKGVRVSEFMPNKAGEYVTVCAAANSQICHVQRYVEGETFPMYEAPAWFMEQSAETLGEIHEVLKEYEELPVGIGKEFFRHMTPGKANASYRKSLLLAVQQGEERIAEELEFRIHLSERMKLWEPDCERLTYRNTHGDYNLNQIICRDGEIKAVIDWTTACTHPVVWEIARSFYYGHSSGRDGILDEKAFANYVAAYEERAKLNGYDRENLLRLYYYQLAVCDYYYQYFHSENSRKEEFLWQAQLATNILKQSGANYLL